MKRTALDIGAKSRARGTTFAARPRRLPAVNVARRDRLQRLQFDPAGITGPFVTALRQRQCDTCAAGKPFSRVRQSDPSHVVDRSLGGRWWEQVSQCRECHREIDEPGGWGCCRELALRLAHAIAWQGRDDGLLEVDPPVKRPPLTVEEYRGALRACWPGRHESPATEAP